MQASRLVVLAAVLVLACCGYVFADSTIDSNSFTYDSAQTKSANDFHLQVDGAFKDPPPESDVFPNRSYTGGTADFKGNTIAPGSSTNITFSSSGSTPAPTGYFTLNGKQIGPVVKSKALDGTTVAYVPTGGGGYACTLTVTNAFGSPLSGTCAVYVCFGHDAHFSQTQFNNPAWRMMAVMPPTPYVFPNGAGFMPLAFPLASDDEYILIEGTADAGDGAGPKPFWIGLSPVEWDIDLGDARRQPNGRHVLVSALVTFNGADEEGHPFFYIEEETRASGIRCYCQSGIPQVGAKVKVYGVLGTRDGERIITCLEPIDPTQNETGLTDPFEMRARDVGGDYLDIFNPGVTHGRGAFNVGLLEHLSGMVTAVDPLLRWMYVWDGSNTLDDFGFCSPMDDGTGNLGVRVEPGYQLAPWMSWVDVTGVCSATASVTPGRVVPRILASSAPEPISEFQMVESVEVPRPPLFTPDILYPDWNIFSLPAPPAALGDGIPPPFSPKPWDPPVILGHTPDEINWRMYRIDSMNQTQYWYDAIMEPLGWFGGMVAGDAYWLRIDEIWRAQYSAHWSHYDQWMSIGSPDWIMMGLPRFGETPWAAFRVHEGGKIVTLRSANELGEGWLRSTGFWLDNQTKSQWMVGLPEDAPAFDYLTPWYGYWFAILEGRKAFIVPGEPELRFKQIDFQIEGTSIPNSSWGDCFLTFTGSEDVMYFNLKVNGNWVVQDVPVPSGAGVGNRQTVGFNFDLGVPSGINVTNLNYVYSLTSHTLWAPPTGTPVSATVGDERVRMNSGIKGATIPTPGIAPLIMGSDALLLAIARATFTNQECPNVGECVPTAVSNSLKYLNDLNGLGLTDAQTSIGTMKTATGYDPSPPPGCYSNWPTTKDNYMQANGYPINTTTTTNWDDVVNAVNNGADVELRSPTHCAAVTGATKNADGTYTFTVSHDTDQGNAGGCKTETVTFDPATGKYTGGAGFDGQTARPTCIETKK